MPKRYGKKRRYRRRSRKGYRRKRYRRALRRSYVPSGLATTRLARLRYSSHSYLNVTFGILQSFPVSANAVRNPSLSTLLTSSPMGWSAWEAAYNKYVCLGSKITVICNQTGQNAGGSDITTCNGVYLSERSSTTYTTREEYIMAQNTTGRGRWQFLNGQRNQQRALKATYSAKKFWNLKDVKDNQNLWSLTSTVPASTAEAYYIIWCDPVNELVQNIRVEFQLIFDFIVAFAEPKNVD